MKPAEETERKSNAIEEAYSRISKLQEQLPLYLNEESEIIGADPQELHISLPPSTKERGCINSPFPKKKTKDPKYEEAKEEPEEWDTKQECAGRFDEQGNFILEEANPQEEFSTGEDWVTVDLKTKKKKQKEKDEQLTYTAVQTLEQKKTAKLPKKNAPKSKEESDTDSDGFKVVHDKKSKKSKKPTK
ncbi:hypothetical protein NEMIN01_1212 [Nematocida minor]|uniref:uncharacterized protein n=1 Tax=Nematocida minor TaxID=1912983 RepID=UPI00221F17AC|nr:uncharacterized protein NEMIN01_1212 [Nematocida minor]KAI5190810.1 hypothetical protein NEMIN01_1212 [Nematocida minor]